MNAFEQKVLETIRRNRMAASGDGILIALSGGADSVSLFLALLHLRRILGVELRVLHVHHGLRGREADRDADFTRKLASRHRVPCMTARIDAREEARAKGMSVEEAGREARYRILEQAAAEWEKEMEDAGAVREHVVHIATAHHADDDAETILLNLFRGTGLKGLGGMPPVRGRVIRPLIDLCREEILGYLKENGQDYVTDSTNRDNAYTRNYIRNVFLPGVTDKVNPAAARHIREAGERIRQADRYLMDAASGYADRNIRRGPSGEMILDAAALSGEADILREYVVREALLRAGCPARDITARHIRALADLLLPGESSGVMLPYGIAARREQGRLLIGSAMIFTAESEEIQLSERFRTEVFPNKDYGKIPTSQYTKWFDYDKITSNLSIRLRETGDYLTLPGGTRKLLRRFMIDEKIPAGERNRIPLVTEGSHVLWVVGYRISEYYKVTEDTATILQITYRPDGGAENG